MQIHRSGSRPPGAGPASWFTGAVTIEPVFDANEASAISAARVTFQPGARSAWHTHPKGQRLIVTEGTGWTQVEGGPVEEIRSGDVVWCPPGVRHWHGATPGSTMTHIAIQEAVDGSPVHWMEHVTDAVYRRRPGFGAPLRERNNPHDGRTHAHESLRNLRRRQAARAHRHRAPAAWPS